jgi:zinc/manganese transport system ATP-binding protein
MYTTKTENLVSLKDAGLRLGGRTLWEHLSLNVSGGTFIAVLGPNGAGKSSLLKVLLGLQAVSSGTVTVADQPAKKGNPNIGYVPQQKSFDASLPIRGRDIVELGLNGYRFGIHRTSNVMKKRVDEVLAAVDATSYADNSIGLLSGGEQQRLRIAQAIANRPQVLLCDEPLLSLDLASQGTITDLINEYRKQYNAAVIFVTHEINPILSMVDKILYIANGKWVLDKPDNVLQSETLSQLYGTRVEVLRLHGRVLVVGADEASEHAFASHQEGHHS